MKYRSQLLIWHMHGVVRSGMEKGDAVLVLVTLNSAEFSLHPAHCSLC